jgi:hypothetical protein
VRRKTLWTPAAIRCITRRQVRREHMDHAKQ